MNKIAIETADELVVITSDIHGLESLRDMIDLKIKMGDNSHQTMIYKDEHNKKRSIRFEQIKW